MESKQKIGCRGHKVKQIRHPIPDITNKPINSRLNHVNVNQDVRGVKQGFKEVICKAGGLDALTSILQQADGQPRSVEDYYLH